MKNNQPFVSILALAAFAFSMVILTNCDSKSPTSSTQQAARTTIVKGTAYSDSSDFPGLKIALVPDSGLWITSVDHQITRNTFEADSTFKSVNPILLASITFQGDSATFTMDLPEKMPYLEFPFNRTLVAWIDANSDGKFDLAERNCQVYYKDSDGSVGSLMYFDYVKNMNGVSGWSFTHSPGNRVKALREDNNTGFYFPLDATPLWTEMNTGAQ